MTVIAHTQHTGVSPEPYVSKTDQIDEKFPFKWSVTKKCKNEILLVKFCIQKILEDNENKRVQSREVARPSTSI